METKPVNVEPTETIRANDRPQKAVLPVGHPLATVVDSARNEPLWEMLWEEINAYRARLDQEERERLDREEAQEK